MSSGFGALRTAWGLFRTDSREDTYLAVGIVGVVLAPYLYQYLRGREGAGR